MGYSNSCPDTSTPASRMSRTDVPSRLDHIIHHKDLDSGLCCLTDLVAQIGLVDPISLIDLISPIGHFGLLVLLGLLGLFGLLGLLGIVRVVGPVGFVRAQFFVPEESVAA